MKERGAIVGGIARFSGELNEQKIKAGVVVCDSERGYVDITPHYTQSQTGRSYWSIAPLEAPINSSEKHYGC